jgi:hypothetical protein
VDNAIFVEIVRRVFFAITIKFSKRPLEKVPEIRYIRDDVRAELVLFAQMIN